MLSQVIKVVEPQRDSRPVRKWSDLEEKIRISDATVLAVLKFYKEEAKKQKQQKIRECAQNWCLK